MTIMSSNTPPTKKSTDQPSSPNRHDTLTTPNRSHVATQKHEEYPLELLTHAISATEA